MIGSILGVKTIIGWFDQVRCSGPRLKVDIHYGALTEAFLTFTIVTVSLNLKKKTNKQTNPVPMSFFMKTWISSISKLSLHLLGFNFTGGSMNPATVSISYRIISCVTYLICTNVIVGPRMGIRERRSLFKGAFDSLLACSVNRNGARRRSISFVFSTDQKDHQNRVTSLRPCTVKKAISIQPCIIYSISILINIKHIDRLAKTGDNQVKFCLRSLLPPSKNSQQQNNLNHPTTESSSIIIDQAAAFFFFLKLSFIKVNFFLHWFMVLFGTEAATRSHRWFVSFGNVFSAWTRARSSV